MSVQVKMIQPMWRALWTPMYTLFIISAASIISLGCDDPLPPPVKAVDMALPEIDQEVVEVDQEVIEVDQEIVEVDQEIIEPQIGWIELNLAPVRSFYTLSDEPEVTVEVYNEFGDPFPSAPLRYSLSSPVATLSDRGEAVPLETETSSHQVQMQLLGEGFVDLVGCSAEEETASVCATRPLLIDDSAPTIEVFWPPRGVALSMEDPWVSWSELALDAEPPALSRDGVVLEENLEQLKDYMPVYGQVSGLGDRGEITLNGMLLSPNEQGYFATYIDSSPEYKELTLVADDAVRFSQVTDRRWVLLAADYLPHAESDSLISDGIEFSLQQSFIDGDSPPVSDGPLVSDEIAQLLDLFLGLIDPNELIIQSSLVNTPELQLSINDLSLGRPDIDLQITDEGLSLLLSLNQVTVEVSGAINIGSSEIDLSGSLQISLSAFSDYSLAISDAPLEVQYEEGAVVITRITPDLNEESANAVLSVVESTARSLIIEQIEGQVLTLIERDIPLLLESAVGDVYRELEEIPLMLSTGLEGALRSITLDPS